MASESSRPRPAPTAPQLALTRSESVLRPHLQSALTTVRQHLHQTPLVPVVLGKKRNSQRRAKLETRQIMGSFKTRGAITRLQHLDLTGSPGGIITASAGNHGLGIGWAANLLGLQATIVIPRNTPNTKRLKLEALARTVIAPYDGYDDTERYARGLAKTTRARFISAFDDPYVIAGNGATLTQEILSTWPACERIVCPVGGGGLASGIIRYCEEFAAHKSIEIIGVQSETNDAMAQSLALGLAVVSLPPTPTLAEGLEGGICARTFEICRRGLTRILTVSEDNIGRAMARCFQNMGEVIEGSAAVGLAALLDGQLPDDDIPTCVILTGRNVDSKVHDAQLAKHLGPARKIGEGER